MSAHRDSRSARGILAIHCGEDVKAEELRGIDFLALAARRLDGRGHRSANDVRAMRFNKSKLGKRGFNEQQVDAVLAE